MIKLLVIFNVRVDSSLLIKVADFGLAGRVLSKDYLRLDKSVGGKMPVKWMAPESLSDFIFSQKSDVVCKHPPFLMCLVYTCMLIIILQWAYGVTCWEIFSGGESPYPGIQPSEILTYLKAEKRLKIPHNRACSEEM